MTVKFVGLNELKVGLKKRTNLSIVAQIVKRNGTQMQDGAQRNAPVRTGFLRRNIHLNYSDGGMTAKVTSDAYYAGYVEFGTRFMAARAHVGPAYKVQKPIFISDLEKIMK